MAVLFWILLLESKFVVIEWLNRTKTVLMFLRKLSLQINREGSGQQLLISYIIIIFTIIISITIMIIIISIMIVIFFQNTHRFLVSWRMAPWSPVHTSMKVLMNLNASTTEIFNSLRPRDAYMRHKSRPSLFGAKPLSDPMLKYC